jgi:phage FluMu protein Com
MADLREYRCPTPGCKRRLFDASGTGVVRVRCPKCRATVEIRFDQASV